jgi:hypothetical protein
MATSEALPAEARVLPEREARYPSLPPGRWVPVLGAGFVADYSLVSLDLEPLEVFAHEVEVRGTFDAERARLLELAFYRAVNHPHLATALREQASGLDPEDP